MIHDFFSFIEVLFITNQHYLFFYFYLSLLPARMLLCKVLKETRILIQAFQVASVGVKVQGHMNYAPHKPN